MRGVGWAWFYHPGLSYRRRWIALAERLPSGSQASLLPGIILLAKIGEIWRFKIASVISGQGISMKLLLLIGRTAYKMQPPPPLPRWCLSNQDTYLIQILLQRKERPTPKENERQRRGSQQFHDV